MPDGELDCPGGVAWRCPLLPFGVVERLTGGAAAAAWRSGGDLDAAVARDLATLDAVLREQVADPFVRAAVALASPSLDAALDGWLAAPGTPPPLGLLGYVTRMAGRPAPYGLFAGCAAGVAAGEPAYALAPRSAVRVRARLDVGVAERLLARSLGDPVARDALRFVPNPTAHVAGGRLRLVERDGDGPAVRYHPVAVEDGPELRAVLGRARDGATPAELAAALVSEEVTFAEAYDFVAELVAAQVLLPDVPVVTGGALLHDSAVAAFGAEPAPERLRAAVAAVRERVPGTPPDRAVHADTTRPGTVVLGDAVLREARRAVEVLHPLYREPPGDADLARFRAAFAARYGATEVPLLEALDPETGVGFGAPLALAAAGAPLLAGFVPPPSADGQVWTPVDHHLVDLMSRALRDRAREIVLGPEDLGPLRNQRPRPLPDALAVVATVAARSAEAVRAGEFRLVVHEVRGPDGLGLVSRFGALEDGVAALLRDHAAREQAARPDTIVAEVVHLPDRRGANVVVRPAAREWEIPLFGASGVPPERRVAPADLLVSVDGDRVVLRSALLGREVVPRLTTAHDWRTSSLPAYRFLGALQHDAVASPLRWSWGQVQSAPFLPRVTVGRLVLSRAQWRWFRAELAPLTSARTTAARYAALRRLRDEWDVPRWATLVRGGEQDLPVDLDGVAAAELLAREARLAGQLWLRELLPGPDELCLTGEEGAFAHEVVVPFVRPGPVAAPAAPRRPRPAAYVPGTEWLGVRLYTGIAEADGVLTGVVPALSGWCDGWFYDRLTDPAPHLRLRLHGDPAALLAALRAATGPLVADGRVADVVVDTYRPDADERVAHADSVAALRIVAATDLDARWRAALWGVDRLLADAGLAGAERTAAIRRGRDRLVAAHGETGTRAARWAGRVYRSRRATLAGPEPWLGAVLAERSAVVAPLLAGVPADVLDDLCARSVARLLRAAHGVQHLVIYDLLDRLSPGRAAGTSSP